MLSALRNKNVYQLLGLRSLNSASIARFSSLPSKKDGKEEVNPRSLEALKKNHWLVNDQTHKVTLLP